MRCFRCSPVIFCLVIFSLQGCSGYWNIRPQADENVGSFKILTYNIRIGAGLYKYGRSSYRLKDEISPDLQPVIEAIRSVDADVVALQEVLGWSMARKLGQALGMNYAYVDHGYEEFGEWWGLALLSKHEILEVHRSEISWLPGFDRSMLVANIRIGKTETIIANIHKDHRLAGGNSLRFALHAISKITRPIVLAGDLNIQPGDWRHSILEQRFTDTALAVDTDSAQQARQMGTYPGRNQDIPGRRIDYILADTSQLEILDAGLMPQEHWPASDHLGYYARLRFKTDQ
jgi:endonuclease/exonuclease/phosphatase family metal-dependent hydrolase